MPGPGEVAYVLEDALVALVTSAAAANSGGKLNAPSQYAPIAIVERVVPQEQRLYPSVAAQFRSSVSTPSGLGVEEVTSIYDLAIAVQQPYSATQGTATIATARAKLRAFVDDGAGNGLIELLRSVPNLANLCRRSKVVSWEEVTLLSGSSTAGTVVAMLVVFQCDYSVKIF